MDEFLDNLSDAVGAVEGLAPLAEKLGGSSLVGQVASAAGGLIAIAENVKTRLEEGVVVATSNDRVAVAAIIRRLATVNDQLAASIAAS